MQDASKRAHIMFIYKLIKVTKNIEITKSMGYSLIKQVSRNIDLYEYEYSLLSS